MISKVERINSENECKVVVYGNGTVPAISLTAEEALMLSDELKSISMDIMDEVYNMPIVPRMVKALIDCGKVARLEYSVVIHAKDADCDSDLFNIRAIFVGGGSRSYMYQCKFFENKSMLDIQLDYVNNIPVVFKDKNNYPHTMTINGITGYNIGSLIKKDDDDEAEQR